MHNENTKEALTSLLDRHKRGLINTAEANVEMVRIERVRIVENSLPREVRSALSAAVKDGRLAHLKRDGHLPEVYFHPTFRHLAAAERRMYQERIVNALRKVAGWPASAISAD